MLGSQAFFWRTLEDGRREVSWRVWVLIWVAPVLFLLAGAGLLVWEGYRHLASVPTEAEVVRVYEWDGEGLFTSGTKLYGPVFRYVWSDGETTEATSGMSDPDWNFEIGSTHQIRYFPAYKANVVFPGAHNWLPGLIVGAIGLILTGPALWGSLRIRRWLRAGA